MVTPCSVAPFALENDASECKLGQTYGCFNGERRMWTIGKCAGEFHCVGFRLFCGARGLQRSPDGRTIARASSMRFASSPADPWSPATCHRSSPRCDSSKGK